MKKESNPLKFDEVVPVTPERTIELSEKQKAPFPDIGAIVLITAHFIVPVLCWCLPFGLAFKLDIPWWQGFLAGYVGSAAIMMAYLIHFQGSMGRGCRRYAVKLGFMWPIATLSWTDIIGLTIALGIA